MRFVTTYQKNENEAEAVNARKKFNDCGTPLQYRAFGGDGRHYSLSTPAFLLEHLKKGQPITWVDVSIRFSGYPDLMPVPKNYDIIATEAGERQTLHPSNFSLNPLILFPTEQTLLLLKYWIAACDEAGTHETWNDTFARLMDRQELERIGVDFLLLPRAYVNKFYARDSRKPHQLDEPGDSLPYILTTYDTSRTSAQAALNIQRMNAESLGFHFSGIPRSTGIASLLYDLLHEHNESIYRMPERLALRRIPWHIFTTHADLVLVGKPDEKLTLTHAFVKNSQSAARILQHVESAPEGITNKGFADMFGYELIKIVDIPNSLHEEIFCEERK